MWSARSEKLAAPSGLRIVVEHDSKPATYSQVIASLRDDRTFRSFLTQTLTEIPFLAFRWETPGVAKTTIEKPFEFVVLDNPGLARKADEQAFAEHFTVPSAQAVSFSNLGNNAILIVPSRMVEATAYGHLAAFVRNAPASQHQALWQLVGEAMSKRIGTRPVWLSTAGAGVSWLHVRLDDQPKYYGYMPYARRT